MSNQYKKAVKSRRTNSTASKKLNTALDKAIDGLYPSAEHKVDFYEQIMLIESLELDIRKEVNKISESYFSYSDLIEFNLVRNGLYNLIVSKKWDGKSPLAYVIQAYERLFRYAVTVTHESYNDLKNDLDSKPYYIDGKKVKGQVDYARVSYYNYMGSSNRDEEVLEAVSNAFIFAFRFFAVNRLLGDRYLEPNQLERTFKIIRK